MRYLSVCSGIEAASVAWSPLGWMPVAFSEIDQFPSAVLAHRYPDVPNWGDMTQFEEWPDADVDVLVGGTPCQSFSVAGLRKGLADPRGNLTLTYLAIAERYRPDWLVWENVPGVLSSGGGRDFGAFLGGLVELGYGWAYRVLDAQFFGVAQRRRRVFVVASARGWAAAAAVLFEPSGLRGDPAPRREAGEGAAGRAARSLAIRGRDGIASAELGDDKANAILTPSGGRAGVGVGAILEGPAHALRGEGFDASEDGTGRGTPLVPVLANTLTTRMHKGINTTADESQTPIVEPIPFDETQVTHPANRSRCAPGDPSPTLARGARPPAVAFNIYPRSGQGSELEASPTVISNTIDATASAASTERGTRIVEPVAFTASEQANSYAWEREYAPTVMAQQPSETSNIQTGVRIGLTVRRLTPRETERLQGFPDDWTLVPYRGKPAKDGPRYKAIGNSMAVPVVRWIGERVQGVETLEIARGRVR